MRNYLVIRNNGGKPEAATVLRQLKSGKYLVRTSNGIIEEEDGSNLFDYKTRGYDSSDEAIGDILNYEWSIMDMSDSDGRDIDGIDSLDGQYFWGGVV